MKVMSASRDTTFGDADWSEHSHVAHDRQRPISVEPRFELRGDLCNLGEARLALEQIERGSGVLA
jgi:hypothetical protein